MAADGLQQVDEKEFADLQGRCRVNRNMHACMLISCFVVFMFYELPCNFSELFMNCALRNLTQLVVRCMQKE